MLTRAILISGLLVAAAAVTAAGPDHHKKSVEDWPIHDKTRPRPPVVDPGSAGTPQKSGQPPSDAIVLFDGTDLSKWESVNEGPAKWKVENGYFEVVAKTGGIRTKQGFGDAQIHVEWMSPDPPRGEDQNRGNSGVFPMGFYEIQVLDSFKNDTYPDGQASALYGQYPPLANASRPPGQWQTYDIIFRGPQFAEDGKLLSKARVTVFHNGVLTQDNVELTGPTTHKARPPYKAHAKKLPMELQDHDHPVRFRNIWLRELD